MQDFPFEPRPKPVAGPGTVRWLIRVHLAFAMLWALLDLVIVGGAVLIGDFAGATVDVDPPDGGFPFPIGLMLILGVPALLHLLLAWGTRERAHWARKGSIAVGLATMLAIPIGTVLGVYLVCLWRRDWLRPDA